MRQYSQFVGLLFSQFEEKVKEIYPFGDISFSGGGSLVIDTGMKYPNDYGRYVSIEIHTDLGLYEAQDYEEKLEERICFLKK